MEITNAEFGTTFVKITGDNQQTTERFLPMACQVTLLTNEHGEPQQYIFCTNVFGGRPSENVLRIFLNKENNDYSISVRLGNHMFFADEDILTKSYISEEEYKELEQKMWELSNPHVEYDLDNLMNLLRNSNRHEYTEILAKYDKLADTLLITSNKLSKKLQE